MDKIALCNQADEISLFAGLADNLVNVLNVCLNRCAGLCFEYQVLCSCSF